MADYRAQGFGALKMKVGKSLREDVERVRAVREAIGDDCELMVDAEHGVGRRGGGAAPASVRAVRSVLARGAAAPAQVDGFAELQRGTSIPLSAGETLFTPDEFTPYFRRSAIRIPQPDVIRLGVTGWRRVASAALDAGLPVAPHFIPEIHVHLACAVPNALNLEYLPIFELLLEQPLRIENGRATPPDTAGHGMRFSEQALIPYRAPTEEVHLR